MPAITAFWGGECKIEMIMSITAQVDVFRMEIILNVFWSELNEEK
jgi:hypothetical protein